MKSILSNLFNYTVHTNFAVKQTYSMILTKDMHSYHKQTFSIDVNKLIGNIGGQIKTFNTYNILLFLHPRYL